MTRLERAIAIFLVALGITAAGASTLTFPAGDPPKPAAGPALKVIASQGHGTGVHIGNGFVVTAAHVVNDAKQVTLKTDTGEELPADVLWINKAYDLALLTTAARPRASALLCAAPNVGAKVYAIGNPGKLEFIRMHGRVAAEERKYELWASAMIVDITIAPGVSGGPLYDQQGRVIGIIVGMSVVNLGFSPSALGYAYVVPTAAVCKLLARA